MKIDKVSRVKARHGKRPLTFGDFVTGMYHIWGQRQAKGIIQLAVKAHMIEFCGPDRFVIS